jgi:hypothetical protein
MVSMNVATNPHTDSATTGAVLLDKDELAASPRAVVRTSVVRDVGRQKS